MDKAQEKQPEITFNGDREIKSPENEQDVNKLSAAPLLLNYKIWIQLALFSFFLMSGQAAATLLGRLYFEKGGTSKWIGTLVQTVGFPILLPFLCTTKRKNQISDEQTKSPSALVLGSIYVVLGFMVAAICMLFTVGIQYLPVSTFALVSATQLAFNAIFSFFLNSQKLTPYVINSVVLLTTSSGLLVVQTDLGSSEPRGKYFAGFICTMCAAAGYALVLSLSQLAFEKILKKQTVKELMDFIIYEALVATCIILIGLFASGEWKTIKAEMNEFELGKASYTVTLIWTALAWQIFNIGILGLIVKSSALFANVISSFCLPIISILAVIIFKDKMSGVKAVALLLAIWGFTSYIYQHYLDDLKSKAKNQTVVMVPEVPLIERA